MAAKTTRNEIHIVRVYDAPVSAVWDAWTDPVQVAKWWGPRGFTITHHSKDLRPGGHWNYTMHGPDGTDWPNTTKYLEVEKHAKLVYDHGGSADRPALFRVTVLFSEKNGKTTMDMRMTLPDAEALARTREIIRKAGGNSTWDRLGEYLEKEATGKETFIINRTFDAPIDVMFKMWTDPHHLAQWSGPAGSTMEFLRADIRPGGTSFYVMTFGGKKMYGRATYHTIQPDLLVYTQQFVDEHENPARHPMAPTFPSAMTTTVRLAEEAPGITRVTVTWEPHGTITAEEAATLIQARTGMTGGWTGSFDKLEALLTPEPAPA